MVDGGDLSTKKHLVRVVESVGSLANNEHPCRVGGISVLVAAEIDHDGIPLLNDPVARFVMRRGTVGPGSHYPEVHSFMAGPGRELNDLSGNIAFCPI